MYCVYTKPKTVRNKLIKVIAYRKDIKGVVYYTQYPVSVVLNIQERLDIYSLTTRMSEHKRAVKNKDITIGIAMHVITTN